MTTKALSLKLDSLAADPAAPPDGLFWYNSTDNAARVRVNGVTCDIACNADLPQAGAEVVGSFAAGPNGNFIAAVVFPTPYAAAPTSVVVTACGNNGCIFTPNVVPGTITTTGFTIDIGTSDVSDLVDVKWISVS